MQMRRIIAVDNRSHGIRWREREFEKLEDGFRAFLADFRTIRINPAPGELAYTGDAARQLTEQFAAENGLNPYLVKRLFSFVALLVDEHLENAVSFELHGLVTVVAVALLERSRSGTIALLPRERDLLQWGVGVWKQSRYSTVRPFSETSTQYLSDPDVRAFVTRNRLVVSLFFRGIGLPDPTGTLTDCQA